VQEILAERPVWSGCEPLREPRECLVQLRAHGEVHRATVSLRPGGLAGDMLRITLDGQARGVAKGQAAVLYDGDTVLGSATISGTRAAAVAAGPQSAR
jgi:tRNA-specific 2-thiouridylase